LDIKGVGTSKCKGRHEPFHMTMIIGQIGQRKVQEIEQEYMDLLEQREQKLAALAEIKSNKL